MSEEQDHVRCHWHGLYLDTVDEMRAHAANAQMLLDENKRLKQELSALKDWMVNHARPDHNLSFTVSDSDPLD